MRAACPVYTVIPTCEAGGGNPHYYVWRSTWTEGLRNMFTDSELWHVWAKLNQREYVILVLSTKTGKIQKNVGISRHSWN
ncbi:hypothetical protein BaRGS_00040095 [Batillaria attramentaria]|uniref:Uncharacterized protein n=1 Tax=Batillaria attramentaria TaxID=370345 RepID=A0ABD0J172_9CAEN